MPVILLSWKEDLLQRVRELGASAAAYLRKESDSRAILARVRECSGRARASRRACAADGEVRGRLDGLTARSLLELVCAIRTDARVAVRDASFLYEVEIRDGAPKRDHADRERRRFQRGERVLAAMLGVGAGRFTVCAERRRRSRAEERDLAGSLFDQLAPPLAIARAARIVTTGARTMEIERIELDASDDADARRATPEPARSIVRGARGGEGAARDAPRRRGRPELLEEVLGDLAARGAVHAVWTHSGEEILAQALESLLAPPEPAIRSAPPPAQRSSARPLAERLAPDVLAGLHDDERPRPGLPGDAAPAPEPQRVVARGRGHDRAERRALAFVEPAADSSSRASYAPAPRSPRPWSPGAGSRSLRTRSSPARKRRKRRTTGRR